MVQTIVLCLSTPTFGEGFHQPLLIWFQATLGNHLFTKFMEHWWKDIILEWPGTDIITLLSPSSSETFSWISFQGWSLQEHILDVCHPAYYYLSLAFIFTQWALIIHGESKNQQSNKAPERKWLIHLSQQIVKPSLFWETGWKWGDRSWGNGIWQNSQNIRSSIMRGWLLQ